MYISQSQEAQSYTQWLNPLLKAALLGSNENEGL